MRISRLRCSCLAPSPRQAFHDRPHSPMNTRFAGRPALGGSWALT